MNKEKVNLTESFEKLKNIVSGTHQLSEALELYNGFLDANKMIKGSKEDKYPEAFGILSMKVKKFLVVTTVLTIEDIDERLSIL